MMRSRTWGAVCALILAGTVTAAGSARAEEPVVVEKVDRGEINWTDKTVMATGSGAPDLKLPNIAAIRINAERTAQVAAVRNILEAIKGVRISTTQTGQDALQTESVRAQVEGVVKGCRTVDTRYFQDGGVDVVVRCALDGSLSAVLAPPKPRRDIQMAGERTYSGLIVDATGAKAKPALGPRLLADNGAELFVPEMVKTSFLQKQGAVAYHRSVESAKKNPRVGDNPLVVKGVGVPGSVADLKIAPEDVAKINGTNQWFLVEGRVAIVID